VYLPPTRGGQHRRARRDGQGLGRGGRGEQRALRGERHAGRLEDAPRGLGHDEIGAALVGHGARLGRTPALDDHLAAGLEVPDAHETLGVDQGQVPLAHARNDLGDRPGRRLHLQLFLVVEEVGDEVADAGGAGAPLGQGGAAERQDQGREDDAERQPRRSSGARA
jgi:hypothetical protein